MDNIYLAKYGEIWVKGRNKYIFEDKLVDNIKNNIKDLGDFKVRKNLSQILVEPIEFDTHYDETLIEKIRNTFGVVGVAKVYRTKDKSLENIKDIALMHAKEATEGKKLRFKIVAKRADKSYKVVSQQIASEVGGYIFNNTDNLTVDVNTPEFVLRIEVRDEVYIYSNLVAGIGGLPVGTNDKALVMLSGGIDSPVAAWMIGKRGAVIDAVYFHSSPYTSERAKQKVIDLAKKVSKYTGNMTLYVVPFTNLQLHMREKCKYEALTIIMRRVMFKISEIIAKRDGAYAIITGESVGQVASQTMQSIYATNDAVSIPVFRPLIGFDKEEIMQIAKKIDTYNTSILPYEDCCTIFVAKHPQTKPRLDIIIKEEQKMDKLEELISEAVEGIEVIKVEN
ncbi:MAG TPA: tRNA 4-thiouridine(8) synthase ThiI [Clostridiales bacterium]|nr:MAG: tRNA 4-thiouridine(8) synthase ThiI [Clostridiales bacterium GWD2_32_59]HAN10241.1 tRNA 4-thiouridine(8) synthase ThiI [Clostridiales bacterium]